MVSMQMHPRTQRGVSLVEVLVAMVILAVGLLGLVGLQGRLHVLQMESYQRAQALMLLHDMASRVMLNRSNADDYVTASPLGEGADCSLIVGATRSDRRQSGLVQCHPGFAETIGADDTGSARCWEVAAASNRSAAASTWLRWPGRGLARFRRRPTAWTAEPAITTEARIPSVSTICAGVSSRPSSGSPT